MSLSEQIKFIESLMLVCGESAKPKFKAILESLNKIKY